MIHIIVLASLSTFLGDLGHAKALQGEIQQLLPAANALPVFDATVEGYNAFKKTILDANKDDKYIVISIGEIGIAQFNKITEDGELQKNNLALVWGGHQYLPELDPLIGKLTVIDLPAHERAQIIEKLKDSKTRLVTAIGVPHDFTKENLTLHLDKWKKEIEEAVGDKKSCIGVILGGDAPDRNKQTHKFTPLCATQFGAHVATVAKQRNAAVIITAGGRTSKEALDAFTASLGNAGVSYKLFDANAKGVSYALLAFLNNQSSSKKIEVQSFVTFDSITMGTAAIEILPGSVVAVGVDSMSESHLAFADSAYQNGLVSYLQWQRQPKTQTYYFSLQERTTGLKFASESAVKTFATGIIKALTELDFFPKQKRTSKEPITFAFDQQQTKETISSKTEIIKQYVSRDVFYV